MIVIDGVEMVDVDEAARLAHRSPETVRRWVGSGRLQGIKQGNKCFVRIADLPTRVPSDDADAMTLAEWAALRDARLPRRPGGGSAGDLVLEGRAERAGR